MTSGNRYSTSSVSNPAAEACLVPLLPTRDSIRMRRKKISATASPATVPRPTGPIASVVAGAVAPIAMPMLTNNNTVIRASLARS
ncbi:hypothetical protein D3C87_1598710 [compost metagenome]